MEKDKVYENLFLDTLLNHALFNVMTRYDPTFREEFHRIEKKIWQEDSFMINTEENGSMMLVNRLVILVRSTPDKRYWSLSLESKPSKIYVVARVSREGKIIPEKLAAAMISELSRFEKIYFTICDDSGKLNVTLLKDLYNHFINRWKKHDQEDRWFAILKNLKPERFVEPVKNTEFVLYWVKKKFAPREDELFYDFDLFNGNLEPVQLKEGAWICSRIYEIEPGDEDGFPWFGFEITDERGVARKNELMCAGEKGIIEIMDYMRFLAGFKTWAGHDAAMHAGHKNGVQKH
jgi:hypothetical protein